MDFSAQNESVKDYETKEVRCRRDTKDKCSANKFIKNIGVCGRRV